MSDVSNHLPAPDHDGPQAFAFDVDYARLPRLARLLAEARDNGPFRPRARGGRVVALLGIALLSAGLGASLSAASGPIGVVALVGVLAGGILLALGERWRRGDEVAALLQASWLARPRRVRVDAHGLDEGEGGGRVPWSMIDGLVTLDGDVFAFYYRGGVLLVPFVASEDADETHAMIEAIEGWHAAAAHP